MPCMRINVVTRVSLRDVKKTTQTLADSSRRTFYYRPTKTRLPGVPGSAEFMAAYSAAIAKMRSAPDGQFRSVISGFKASAEFAGLAAKTQKDYRRYIAAIENEFGSMPIVAIEDPRSRADFLEWRDSLAGSPRAADYAWTVLARVISWGKNRSLLKHNPCERGGRLYAGGGRADIIWKPDDIRALPRHASAEVMTVVMLAL